MALPNLWHVFQPGALTAAPQTRYECAIFWGPASSQHYNSGGGSPEKKKENHYITTNGFSYIRTEFGALRSRPLAEKHATN